MTSKQKYKPISCERLSKITIEQLKKWCDKYNLEVFHSVGNPVFIRHETAYEYYKVYWGEEYTNGIKATLQYIDFIRLLELKYGMKKHIDPHDYENNSKEIYKLVDELEAM